MTDYEKFKLEKKKKAITTNHQDNLATGKVIFGTDKSFPKKTEEIANITDGSGKVSVLGTVFHLDIKEIFWMFVVYLPHNKLSVTFQKFWSTRRIYGTALNVRKQLA